MDPLTFSGDFAAMNGCFFSFFIGDYALDLTVTVDSLAAILPLGDAMTEALGEFWGKGFAVFGLITLAGILLT